MNFMVFRGSRVGVEKVVSQWGYTAKNVALIHMERDTKTAKNTTFLTTFLTTF